MFVLLRMLFEGLPLQNLCKNASIAMTWHFYRAQPGGETWTGCSLRFCWRERGTARLVGQKNSRPRQWTAGRFDTKLRGPAGCGLVVGRPVFSG